MSAEKSSADASLSVVSSCGSCCISLGAVLACIAVGCGALAAHGLDGVFTRKYAGETRVVAGQEISRAEKYLGDFRTGAEYQMYHSLGLIAVGLLMQHKGPSRSLKVAAWSLVIGCVLFSGSLYVLTLTGQGWMGAITPIGGVAYMIGWMALAIGACNRCTTSTR